MRVLTAATVATATIASAAIIASCSDDPSPSDSAESPDTTSAVTPVNESREPSPIPVGTITFAESKYPDIEFNAVDVGQHIVDDVNRQRAVLDKANWQIVTYCPEVVDGELTVGVIKRVPLCMSSWSSVRTLVSQCMVRVDEGSVDPHHFSWSRPRGTG